jgi:hypothetical protein
MVDLIFLVVFGALSALTYLLVVGCKRLMEKRA